MKVAYFPKQITEEPVSLILGAFDYIHNGHLALIQKAKKYNDKIAIVIIEDIQSFKIGEQAKQINSLDNKLQQLSKLGIDFVSVIKFDDKIKNMLPAKYIQHLFDAYKISRIIVGNDFKFGFGGKGNFNELKTIKGAEIITLDLIEINGTKISTSLLRDSIQAGEIDLSSKLTPFPYRPTINIRANTIESWKKYIVPLKGTYGILVYYDNIRYWGYIRSNQNEKWIIYIDSFPWPVNAIDVEIEIIFNIHEGSNDLKWIDKNISKIKTKITQYLQQRDVEK